MSDYSVTWRGKEIRHPLARTLVVMFVIPIALAVIVAGIFALTIILLLTLPVHALLIAFGRRGFAETDAYGGKHYNVSFNGFRKREAA